MYKATMTFLDGESGKPFAADKGGIEYHKGDEYPAGGFKPTQKHIDYLLSAGNAFKKPCIEAVADNKPEEKK